MTANSDEREIAPRSGTAFRVRRGEVLRVVDPLGEQVADLLAFAADDPGEYLSSGRTIDYAETIRLSTGHVVYSNRSRPMLTIVRDDVGRHDFLLTPCSRDTFALLYEHHDDHPGCFGNLSTALEPFGIGPDDIPVSFNIFMNVDIAPDGRISVLPPRSRAGDAIEFRAEMDLIVGLTACAAQLSNNFAFKPIRYAIDRAATMPQPA